MKYLLSIVSLFICLYSHAQKVDSVQIIKNMLIGTWICEATPDPCWIITKDSIQTDESQYWSTYSIEKEKSPGKSHPGVFWFGIHYSVLITHNVFTKFMGNISVDSAYMRFHALESDQDTNVAADETVVFKRKK